MVATYTSYILLLIDSNAGNSSQTSSDNIKHDGMYDFMCELFLNI